MQDLHRFYEHRWINPKAKCKSSGKGQLGVFATRRIKKGEIVAVLAGVAISRSKINEYWKRFGHEDGVQINDEFFICPTSRSEVKRTGAFNHSCEPNIGWLDSLSLITIREVKPGEQLVVDYAFNEVTPMVGSKSVILPTCACGTEHCRKVVTINDWKIKGIRNKYLKYFSPHVKSMVYKEFGKKEKLKLF